MFHADNGLEVRVRQFCPDDVPFLLRIFEKMTADSRYLRFNQSLNNPDPAWVLEQAQQLAHSTAESGSGWLAFADLPHEPNAPIGGVRCMRLSPEVAEVALVVRDDVQGIGIGTNLLNFVAREAHAHGYRKLIGVVQASNVMLWRTLKRLGIMTTRRRDGALIQIEADLDASGMQSSGDGLAKTIV